MKMCVQTDQWFGLSLLFLASIATVSQAQVPLRNNNIGGRLEAPADLKFEPVNQDAQKVDAQNSKPAQGNQQKMQRVGDKVYSVDQLNSLQEDLKGSHFKPLNNDNNNAEKQDKVLDSYALNSNLDKSIKDAFDVAANVINDVKDNQKESQRIVGDSPHVVRESIDIKQGNENVDNVGQAVINNNEPKRVIGKPVLVFDHVGGDANINNNENLVNNNLNKVIKKPAYETPTPKLANDLFDTKDELVDENARNNNGIPSNVRIINGDVEKNNAGLPDPVSEEENRGRAGGNNDVIETNVMHNEIPRAPVNYGNNNNRFDNVPPAVNAHTKDEEEEKPGSLKVVWDWSDFAVNFEQYIMPEQKIRRAPHATTGEPWPMPQYYVTKSDKVYTIDKASFRFDLPKTRCEIIEKAIKRYKLYVLEDAVEDMYDNFQHAQSTMFTDPSLKYETPLYLDAPVLSRVIIKIRKPCSKFPATNSDESYDLFVKRTGIHIWANEVWGALRGLETFSQLVFKGTNQQLYIRDTVINDYPRFSHRGIHIDSSRHFLFKETIYDVLEAMSQNKMNVLHWHIVDDQSFPFYSSAYPDLSAKGAFHPSFVYMPEDIADIIEFARVRGIRVEPEFDTPGHTYSWGLSRPDILTQCYQGDRPVDGYLGPMDPSKNETFRFLKNFFKDVLHVFKDQYLHLGGDEVPMTCWQSNPEVTKFLAKLEGKSVSEFRNNDPYYYSYDIRKVLEYYVTRLIKDVKSMAKQRTSGVRLVFWQEIMNNNVQLPNDTIIQVWQGGMEEVERAISLGMNVIYSTCWYLDLIEYGTKWIKYYQCDPADTTYAANSNRRRFYSHKPRFNIDESKVLGGEACLWAEYVDNENYMTTLWPRGSATAERLWSSKDIRDIENAASRLQEHRCRMLSRGLGVGQMSGPDYCLRRGKKRHMPNDTIASNCTQSQCAAFLEKNRVEVENIKVEFEQKGGHMSDCSQAVIQAGSQLTMVLLVLVLIAVVVTLSVTKRKMAQVRMCKNKTILLVFITLILLYFMCYASIWMQAMEFKGSIEKRKSSNVQS